MTYKFIDLFAGIGGFHLALSQAGMKCVFASEIDKNARVTYQKNHEVNFLFNDDIRKINPIEIPDHDILCAGFPCQPFSQAGKKKGFEDGDNSERGNLFFCIVDILEQKKPKAFILENVRNLLKHDNGNTFNVIKETLEELNYSVFYKIIKASEFGKPQHRPRIYIIGFNNDEITNSIPFKFPAPIPLKQTMSDIWEGECSKEIGFTLRVGGRGSSINDRRNWDAYLVDGKVVQLGQLQGKRMMGYPDDFILPTSIVQAMKQLGNSVCVDVVRHLANSVKEHLDNNRTLINKKDVNMKQNKGEWSELYTFFKLLIDNKLFYIDEFAKLTDDYVTVIEIAHNHSNLRYSILNSDIEFKDSDGTMRRKEKIANIISKKNIDDLLKAIKDGKNGTFAIPSINSIINNFYIDQLKGTSFQKGDLQIAFNDKSIIHHLHPIGIKSYIGSPPTLLNASQATNFIYKVSGLTTSIDSINNISTRSKIKDRIEEILSQNGKITFVGCELNIHAENLKKVDTRMPNILADLLINYYRGKRGNKVRDLVRDAQQVARMKDYLRYVMLGMFSTRSWDGEITSQGSILVQKEGSLQLLHTARDNVLKNYLFNHTRLDTPSSTRHRFGSLYTENGDVFIKLNLQIRMM